MVALEMCVLIHCLDLSRHSEHLKVRLLLSSSLVPYPRLVSRARCMSEQFIQGSRRHGANVYHFTYLRPSISILHCRSVSPSGDGSIVITYNPAISGSEPVVCTFFIFADLAQLPK